MTKSRTLRRAGAVVLSLAMAATTVFAGGVDSKAASKVKLSSTSKTFAAKGGTATVKIKGATSAKISSTTVKSSKTSVATVKKSSKVKFKVTAKKNTATKKKTATITAKVKIAKKYQKKYTKKSYTLKYKVTVKAAAAVIKVTGVTLDNTTPKVGETITAAPDPADAANVKSYQWYRSDGVNEKAINGETSSTYTVQSVDVGYTLYCVITDTAGNKFASKNTGRIAQMEISALTISGVSGKSSAAAKTNNVPVLGDTLKGEVAPAAAADLVSYQWYRGSSAISGATKAEYALTADDIGSKISVKIKAIDKEAVEVPATASEAVTENKVCQDLTKCDISMNKTTASANDYLKLTVKDGTATKTAGNEYKTKWYRGDTTTGTDLGIDDSDNYTVVSADTGKTISIKVNGDYTKNYYGEKVVEVAVGNQELGNVKVKTEDGSEVSTDTLSSAGIGDTLSASFTDSNTTATYEWTVNGKVVSTDSSYVITKADVGMGANDPSVSSVQVRCTATGTGTYSGTDTKKFTISTVNSTSPLKSFSVVDVADSTGAKLANSTGKMFAGHTYSIKTLPATAASSLNVVWAYATTSDTTDYQIVKGSTFTVPADVDTTKAIRVAAYYVGDTTDTLSVAASDSIVETPNTTELVVNYGSGATALAGGSVVFTSESANKFYWIPGNTGDTNDGATVPFSFHAMKSLSSVSVTFDNSESGNKNAAGYKAFETPEVAIYAHASVAPSVACTYQWYQDKVDASTIIADADKATYKIKASDVGKTLICQAKATAAAYAGSTASSTASAVVAASSRTIKSIKVMGDDGSDNVTALTKGVTYTIVATDSLDQTILSGVKYLWDGSASNEYLNGGDTDPEWTATTGKGTITITVTPDGKNYSGDAVSYTFKTEVGDDTTPTGAGTFSFTASTTKVKQVSTSANWILKAGTGVITASISGLPEGVAIESYAWYKKDTESAAAEKIGDAKKLTIDGTNVTAENGNVFYVVVTGSDGEIYKSGNIEVQDAVAKYIGAAADTAESDKTTTSSCAFANGNGSTGDIDVTATGDAAALFVLDQFGEAVTSKGQQAVGTGALASFTWGTDANGNLVLKDKNTLISSDSTSFTILGCAISATITHD